ncbi:MAG: response regulator [Candidatus Aminicenantes bacterium]|nr:response regulator [Candidatus Aminicenantes bacterium]
MAEPRVDWDRYYRDHELRKRVRLAILTVIALYPLFLVLDKIYTPEHFGTFVLIRLVVVVVSAAYLVLLGQLRSPRGVILLGIAQSLTATLGIAIMVQIMGGFKASYYQGLTLVIVGMPLLLPFRFRDTIPHFAFAWAIYVVPGLVLMGTQKLEWRLFINNFSFLTAIVLMGLFSSYVMDQSRRRELEGRIALEQLTVQLKNSNEQLKSIDKIKTQFFSNVSHELRTPLTLILAPLTTLLSGTLPAAHRDSLETMQRNGLRLLKLINNLLDLAKLEEGKMRLKVRTVEANEFIGNILSTVKPTADRKRLRLFFQHPPSDVKVDVDPDQFEKVVLNILSNALKFTPERGRITVYLEERETVVVLTVEDTGIGIPENMLEAVFDRFRQVDGSSSRTHEGTGIGLALAKEIVGLHGGTIRAESEVGRGARFIVEIRKGDAHFPDDVLDRRTADVPVLLKRRESDLEGVTVQDIVSNTRDLQLSDLEKIDFQAGPSRSERKHDYAILVIDDNPEILKLMKLLLQDGFDLDFALSGREGLQILRDRGSDLVLSDIMMPEMDGYALCREIKADESLRHTPVILVTARSGAEMLAEGIESGADDYIAKPFNAVELKARIRALLRMRQVEAELALANRNLKMRTSDLVDRQRALFISMVKSLVSALEAKDVYTRHHSARVTEISLKIAREMGFGERDLADLELAGLLHDIGKIGVAENILNKPGTLTPEEMVLIREHPVHGESILKPVIELAQITKIVRHHHERYDGSGYPDKLKGLEIPLGARIMAVADTYDAITSRRPYRGEESHHFAVKEIIRCSGSQFDPEVVQHFMDMAKEISRISATEPKPASP